MDEEHPNVTSIRNWLRENIFKGLAPREFNKSDYVSYGTAGFRAHAEKLKPLLTNIGIAAVMKCFVTDSDIGIMVTASHNPVEDNGVKIIESDGQMLDQEWEAIFEIVANGANTPADNEPGLELGTKIVRKLTQVLYHVKDHPNPEASLASIYFGRVYIGCDTRPSSREFVDLIKRGVDIFPSNLGYIKCVDFGTVTTPAMHYLVAKSPKPRKLFMCAGQVAPDPRERPVSLADYYHQLLKGFLVANRDKASDVKLRYDPASLVVDCANGVGSLTMKYLLDQAEFRECLPAELINIASEPDDVLNYECGADFVKTKQMPTRGANKVNKRYASLDGDADRLVYFFLDENRGQDSRTESGDTLPYRLKLVDGDKILALFVKYLRDIFRKYQLDEILSFGVVQTAYANGASTEYLKHHLKVKNVDCVDTGVKNLHKKASDYDIAVYFEANGHGTVLVSRKAKAFIDDHDNKHSCVHLLDSTTFPDMPPPVLPPIRELKQLMGMLNNYTGDAVSDMLIVETILRHYDWDIKTWYDMYQDRPNSLIKVEIKDRNVVETTDAGRECLKPFGLQSYIHKAVVQHGPGSRCFVRASGTENVVRIYAEARDQETADRLSRLVGERVVEMCENQ